jgi:uncharacterized protein (TIGR03083 family)
VWSRARSWRTLRAVIDYVGFLRSESARFSECVRNGDLTSPVPSCPDWTLADLAWHLTEVQHYWGTIAGDLLSDPGKVIEMSRPPDEELPDLFDDRSARLVDAVSRHPAAARCWTWDENGWTVGWVRRRQAHEALIHRVDAELAIGHRTEVDSDLASDGIDELLYTHIDGVPDWATFIPDETTATLSVDGGSSYGLRFGRLVGTGPESGKEYDFESFLVSEPAKEYDFESFLVSEPAGTVISGSSVALDLWLWGRDTSGVRCDDPALLDRIRMIVAEATQ